MSRLAFSITQGLSAKQVIQRLSEDSAEVDLVGYSAHQGAIEARVLQGKDVVRDWSPVGERRGPDERFTGRLTGLPVGGPYSIEFRVKSADEAVLGGGEVRNVLVGDLWLLGGQSNMEGVGILNDELEKPSQRVRSFSLADEWEVAQEPLHWLNEAADPVHWTVPPEERPAAIKKARATRSTGAGLGLTFAKELLKRTGVPIGLIPCAHGGTSMEQWSPEKKALGGRSLYGALLRRAAAVGGRVKGMLWYQGESEAGIEAAPHFTGRFKALVQALRADLGAPELPFLYVQLGRFVSQQADPACWNAIREAQRLCEAEIPQAALVSAIDLALDDLIHISTDGLKILGWRLAEAASRLVYGDGTLRTGPRLKEICFTNEGRTELRLAYEGVNGKLVSPRCVGGFTLHNAEGFFKQTLFDARVDPKDQTAVLIRLTLRPGKGVVLYYGGGLNPYCTLVDERNQAAPAFGPLPLDQVETRATPATGRS